MTITTYKLTLQNSTVAHTNKAVKYKENLMINLNSK